MAFIIEPSHKHVKLEKSCFKLEENTPNTVYAYYSICNNAEFIQALKKFSGNIQASTIRKNTFYY